MLRYFLNWRIGKLERETGYDATYARELVGATPWGTLLFFLMSEVAGRRPGGVPVGVWYAAGAGAALEADCGPCVQLGVHLAVKDGMEEGVIRALLEGELGRVPEEVRVAFLFAREGLRRTAEAEALREKLVGWYGKRAATRIAFQVALTHLYPTLKVVMGHGQACTRVRVGTEEIVVRHSVNGTLRAAG